MPNPKKPRKNCLNCGIECKKTVDKYCSLKCHKENQSKIIIQDWLDGKQTGLNAVGQLKPTIRRYIIELGGNKCQECGWNKVNPVSGKSPLEVDHINGNYLDNQPKNLRVLCPNCHSLTPTYKALNMGSGR